MFSFILRFIVVAISCAALCGCSSGRGNAEQEALLTGYQPAPESNQQLATLERIGDNRFRVKANRFDGNITTQRNEQWCWAAVSEAVLRQSSVTKADGTPVTQDDLVRGLRGHKQDQTADPVVLMLAMAPDRYEAYATARERSSQKEGYRQNPPQNMYWEEFQPEPPGVAHAIRDLLSGGIVAVGVDAAEDQMGHIYLVDEAEFGIAEVSGVDRLAPYYVYQMNALDPYTGKRVNLVAEDQLKRVTLAGGRLSAVEYVTAATQGYQHARWVNFNENPQGGTRSIGNMLEGIGNIFK